jgi:hypothetical protein
MKNQKTNRLGVRTHLEAGFSAAPRECARDERKYPCCLARWDGNNLHVHPNYPMEMTGAECSRKMSPFERVRTGHNCYEC